MVSVVNSITNHVISGVPAYTTNLYRAESPLVKDNEGRDTDCVPDSDQDDAAAILHWWRTIGVPLRILLGAAGYTNAAKSRHLENFVGIAIPYFGSSDFPRSSFMTDNGCPVELSVDWGWDGCSPTVRYSMEALCLPTKSRLLHGHISLPREMASLDFITNMSSTFGVPMDMLRYFWLHFVVSPVEQERLRATPGQESTDVSQFFAGFDFDNDAFVLKAYFLPSLRAKVENCSRYRIIKRVLEQSPGWEKFTRSFATVDAFMTSSRLSHQLDAEIFSLDVASAVPTRYKIYVRCQETTFASVREVASLGGRLASPELHASLLQLHQLWLALFLPDSEDEDCSLESVVHRTAGILYYFEMRAGKPVSTPKIYLPVRHYAPSDAHVENTVGAFIQAQAIAAGRDASKLVTQFRGALGEVAAHQPLDDVQGLHTYIGCTLERGTVKLISYINPCFMNST